MDHSEYIRVKCCFECLLRSIDQIHFRKWLAEFLRDSIEFFRSFHVFKQSSFQSVQIFRPEMLLQIVMNLNILLNPKTFSSVPAILSNSGTNPEELTLTAYVFTSAGWKCYSIKNSLLTLRSQTVSSVIR